jgi:hypothetical protein
MSPVELGFGEPGARYPTLYYCYCNGSTMYCMQFLRASQPREMFQLLFLGRYANILTGSKPGC